METNQQRPDAETGSPLIEAKDVSVVFGSQKILNNINLSIERGQTVAIIGESGCGKTVFMKTIVGLISPTRGTMAFDGHVLSRLSHEELAQTRRRFGFVFQNAALFDSMTIFDNVAFPMRQNNIASEEEIRERVMQHLAEVGLPRDVTRKRPAELSGGMRKRVGLAPRFDLAPRTGRV